MHKTVIANFPTCYSSSDKAKVYSLLGEAEHYSSRYLGDWHAPWLLSDIYAIEWSIFVEGVTEKTTDGYLRAEKFSWDVILNDGSRLSNPRNRKFLNGLQESAFLAREYGPFNNWRSHSGYCRFLTILARWAFLHSRIYDPADAFLTRIDLHSIKDFFIDYSKGGSSWLLKIPQKILFLLYKHALNRKPTASILLDPFSVPDEDRSKITKWLLAKGFLDQKNHFHWFTSFIRYLPTTETFGIDTVILRHNKWFSAFLCQFEFDTIPLVLPNRGRHEFPSHKSPLLNEITSSRSTSEVLNNLGWYWRVLLSLKKHIPEMLPDASTISVKSIYNFASEFSSSSKHTPWIPLKVALVYTNEALRWVHNYGKDLVLLYLKVIRFIKGTVRPDPSDNPACKKWRISIESYAQSLEVPASLGKLNISGFFIKDDSYQRFRSNPSICNALNVLLGAIAVIVSFLKPLRESELRFLSVNCVEFVKGDGYWLSQPVRKKRKGDIPDTGSRPVPFIVAKALDIMRTLSDGVKEIEEIADPFLLEKLFVVISPEMPTSTPNLMSENVLRSSLDSFCDYVNIPTDEYGRRWYIRIHEARKSFLITFFWCFRFSSLDAARWMAMHGDVSHIYAYIQANFPGEELPELEAEYASRQLWDFENRNNHGETDNIEDLYAAVCKHFNVNKLNILSEQDIEDWLEIAFRRGIYKINAYSVKSNDIFKNTRIAFKISRKEN
jgi:hypothetical protein